jgi:hypothetical protein
VRDQVHSLKKLGVTKNVSGRIVTPNFKDSIAKSDDIAHSYNASITPEGPKVVNAKKSSRSYLRVRSNQSAFKLNKTESRALEDPSESFDFFYKLIIIGDE